MVGLAADQWFEKKRRTRTSAHEALQMLWHSYNKNTERFFISAINNNNNNYYYYIKMIIIIIIIIIGIDIVKQLSSDRNYGGFRIELCP